MVQATGASVDSMYSIKKNTTNNFYCNRIFMYQVHCLVSIYSQSWNMQTKFLVIKMNTKDLL